jgi:hypothetical protein
VAIVSEKTGGFMKYDLIFLGVSLPFTFFFLWQIPLTALAVFATMLLLRYVSPVGE